MSARPVSEHVSHSDVRGLLMTNSSLAELHGQSPAPIAYVFPSSGRYFARSGITFAGLPSPPPAQLLKALIAVTASRKVS